MAIGAGILLIIISVGKLVKILNENEETGENALGTVITILGLLVIAMTLSSAVNSHASASTASIRTTLFFAIAVYALIGAIKQLAKIEFESLVRPINTMSNLLQ